jgi:hypothetical protein
MAAPVWSKRFGTDSTAIFMNPGQNDDFPTVKPTHEYKDGDGFSSQPASRSMTPCATASCSTKTPNRWSRCNRTRAVNNANKTKANTLTVCLRTVAADMLPNHKRRVSTRRTSP